MTTKIEDKKKTIYKIILIIFGLILSFAWVLVFAEPDLPYIEWIAFIGNVSYVLYFLLRFA